MTPLAHLSAAALAFGLAAAPAPYAGGPAPYWVQPPAYLPAAATLVVLHPEDVTPVCDALSGSPAGGPLAGCTVPRPGRLPLVVIANGAPLVTGLTLKHELGHVTLGPPDHRGWKTLPEPDR